MPPSAQRPPEHRLGQTPEVDSPQDIAVALHELAWLEAVISSAHADLEERIRKLKDEAERKLQTEVDGTPVTCAERTERLVAAIEAYVLTHTEVITETGKKTRKFTHGEVSLRSSKLSVELLKGQKWDGVLQAVRDRGFKRLVVTKYAVDKSRLIDELAADKLTDQDLKQLGLKRKPPEDHVNIKPSEYSLETPAAL